MKKRGSLNLSINAIVILILAITMLGLGLTFMREIFGGATEEFTKVSGTVEKQMIDQMRESNSVIELSRPVVDIKIGDQDQLFIGLRNDQQDTLNFEINSITCNTLGSGGANPMLQCGGGQDVNIAWVSPGDIGGGEIRVLPINIKINTQASEGTCYCTIDVDAGGDPKATELTINVVI